MERYTTYFIILLVIGGGFFFFFTCEDLSDEKNVNAGEEHAQILSEPVESVSQDVQEEDVEIDRVDIPLKNAQNRITKKDFGIFITPENSPAQPERFSGFHTGVDFEIFDAEINDDINIKAVCDGPITKKQFVAGYGGVVAQRCEIEQEIVSVLYGHVSLSSVTNNLGDEFSVGDVIGVLGAHKSPETDGERKHLHLSIVKGSSVDFRGYVDREENLSQWINPCSILSFCD